MSRNQSGAFRARLVEAIHRHERLQRQLAAACKVTSWWGFSFTSHFVLGQVQRVSLLPIMAKVFIDPIIQRLEEQQQSLSSTQILGTEVHWQEEQQALGRYIYWQISSTVKGQKHVLQLHKNKSGPSTLCFGTEPPVLRQIKCKAAEYSHRPQPAQSRNLRNWFHNLKLLFERKSSTCTALCVLQHEIN